MAIYRMMGENKDLVQVPATSFGETGVLERQDLQRILRDKPEILEDGLFILAEEFSYWQGSGRSVDLLGLDTAGRLVVVELKRGDTGEYMDLQSIRYAAMVSTITLQQAIDAHQAYLNKRGIDADAEERVNGHLENPEALGFSTDQPRIVLVSEGFSTELTTSVLWLNRNGLDITCIRMQPYRNGAELLVDTSQVIPLPEAADYLVQIRDRERGDREMISTRGHFIPGGDAFLESIDSARAELRPDLNRFYQWAVSLEQANLATLSTWPGPTTTMPVTVPGKSALVSIYNQPRAARIYFQAAGFRNHAPNSMALVSELIGTNLENLKVSTGRTLRDISEELLDALAAAYREANGLPVDDGDDGGE